MRDDSSRKPFFGVLPFVFLCLLSSCTTHLTSVAPGDELTLQPDQGVLMLAIDTYVSLEELHLLGERKLVFSEEDLGRGTNYLIVPVPAGTYHFGPVYLEKSFLRISIQPNKQHLDLWTFEIQPGVINYVGHLEIINRGYWYTNEMVLLNNSSIAVEFLEREFDSLIDQYGLHYAGPGEDDFFEVVKVQGGQE